jgi:hypothetical protein
MLSSPVADIQAQAMTLNLASFLHIAWAYMSATGELNIGMMSYIIAAFFDSNKLEAMISAYNP